MQDGKPLERIASYPGMTTNTIAEYTAAITCLEGAVQRDAPNITLFADSELLVK